MLRSVMGKAVSGVWILGSVAGFMLPAHAQDNDAIIATEYIERQNIDERLQVLGVGLMGDTIDLNTGALSFEHVDVSLPGNSALEVAIRRTRSQGFAFEQRDAATATTKGPRLASERGARDFGDWELEVPNISVIVPVDEVIGHNVNFDGSSICGLVNAPVVTSARITLSGRQSNLIDPGDPLTLESTSIFIGGEFSNGIDLTIPGSGVQKLLGEPRGVTWDDGIIGVTKDYWTAECLENSGNGGMLVTAPDGRRYRFDRYVLLPAVAMPFPQWLCHLHERYLVLLVLEQIFFEMPLAERERLFLCRKLLILAETGSDTLIMVVITSPEYTQMMGATSPSRATLMVSYQPSKQTTVPGIIRIDAMTEIHIFKKLNCQMEGLGSLTIWRR